MTEITGESVGDVTLDTVEKFAIKHLELLELEREAEIEENKCLQEFSSVKNLQKKGVCIPKLRIINTSTGLFGRSLLNFGLYWGNGSLPTHTISSGDIVGIGSSSSDGKIEIITSGVVSRVTDTTVYVAFEKNSNFSDLENDGQYMIIKLANDVTYKRLKRILKTLQSKGREHHLVDVLFGDKEPSTCEESTLKSISFFNNKLNEEQMESVKFALLQKDVAIIHGPPGTGKTTTVVECILQAISQKLKIIACAPSNVAVDNLVEKLARHKIKMVRLGHPARFLPGIQQYSLDAIVSCYDGSNVVDELHKEIDKIRDKISKTKGAANRKSLWAENRCLLKEVKEREKFIVKQILNNCDIVLCTLTSGSDDGPLKYVDKDHFDVCFIDECSQAIEAACWIPLLMVKKCVLAGDHNQLPPTIISKKAADEGLELTLMERSLKLHGDGIKKMLTTQYRMNQIIMQWPSEKLYGNKLQAHESVRLHLLTDIPGIENNDDTTIPLLLIDTAGCGLHELQADDDESKGNEGEADLVAVHINSLVKSGLNPADIAVITPYNLQVDLIKSRLSDKYPKLEIKSVDGFQGREKEAIVLSLVRSNDIGEVGFLAEDRRINVAITRAKRHLAVICDSKTVSHHEFLKSFLNYCEEKGEVRTAFQYESEIGNYPSIKHSIQKSKSDSKKASAGGSSKKGEQSNVKKKFQPKLQSSNDRGDTKKKYLPNLQSSEDKDTLKRIHSEEEKRLTEEKYQQVLQEFIDSSEMSLTFPTSLTAFERRAVHEVAEKLSLIHISTGEGENRCIEVKKNPGDQPAISDIAGTQSLNLDISSTFDILKTIDEKMGGTSELSTKNKSKSIPKSKTPKNSTEKSKSKLKVLKLKETPEEEDFDALIEQVVKADKTCSFANCKKCVAVLSQVCQFCKRRFCYSHFIPEAHGCGDAAKAHARSQIRKDGVLYSGSGRPEKKQDPIKHNYLQNKLDKKMKELSNKRKIQKKD
ncbi:DNA-binding protein SMUBP-2 [Araneus ventricosus]|uniref:DNA-binding protein SMUBP-2 n=1 Tax=Araneus ventricosus TaxID=182803 RepID=A0A4Y2LTH3_ARAVE|nr:DNA-binding protein SMUBP-2 [Araneus ventricosus]